MPKPDLDALLKEAAAASDQAYAPYSKFKVGAALLAADGTVFRGCNVENASYGLTMCAERSALFAAVAAGRRAFTAIAIVAGGKAMPYPCGACRQVLAEFCDPSFVVVVASRSNLKASEKKTLAKLLPKTFRFTHKTRA